MMENKELEAFLYEFAEINYSNYGQDEVITLQNWALEAYNKLALLGDEPQAQYTAVDMATAAAEGFRDGRASVVVDLEPDDPADEGAAYLHQDFVKARIIAAGGGVKE